jgi:hypothetical protein
MRAGVMAEGAGVKLSVGGMAAIDARLQIRWLIVKVAIESVQRLITKLKRN